MKATEVSVGGCKQIRQRNENIVRARSRRTDDRSRPRGSDENKSVANPQTDRQIDQRTDNSTDRQTNQN